MTGTYAPSAEGGTAFFSPRLPPLFLFARILAICVRLHDNRFQKRDCRDPNRGDEAALEQLRQSYLAQYRKGEPK